MGWRFHRRRSMPYPYRAMPTATVTHLGCKLNQSEAEALSLAFARAGYDIVAPADGPDVFVLNSCTVTHVADRKSRQMLRRAKRRNPGSQVIATGCYAHRAPQDLEAMAEVDLVVDNRDKMRLLEILGVPEADVAVPPNGRRARSMVKIQEGCNQVCAYCIVPKTRGRERSLPIDEILGTMRARTSAGYREIVLTGTQLGSYGFEFGPPPDGRTWYEELVRRALDETGVTRLRFSSLQPREITDGMIDLYRAGRLCPHVHIPLQSGSDAVLRRMRRRYTPADFRRCVDRLRAAAPGIAITTDIIVGFPGETEADFNATVALAEDVAFAQVHVFPYSHRPGTSAAHFADHLDPKTKAAREATPARPGRPLGAGLPPEFPEPRRRRALGRGEGRALERAHRTLRPRLYHLRPRPAQRDHARAGHGGGRRRTAGGAATGVAARP